MLDRRLAAGIAAAALLVLAMVGYILVAPRWAVAALDQMAEQQLGRHVTSRGRVHLDLSPLSIRIEGPALSGPPESADKFIEAEEAVIPVSLGQLLTRSLPLQRLVLRRASIALIVDERGRASWDVPAGARGASRIALEQASIRYFDARNGQAMALSAVDGLLELRADGGISFGGTAIINARMVRIDGDLKSLARVNSGGSPLELVIDAGAASARFSGRLSTARVMSLAGPISVTSAAPADALRWAGIPLPPDLSIPGPFTANGALDSAGRAYGIKGAAVALGAFHAQGDLVADLRGPRPRLQADIGADTAWLDALLPPSGARPGEWGRSTLPFAVLKAFDAEVKVESRAAVFSGLAAGASRFTATLIDGKLDASGAARLAEGGIATFLLGADAGAIPPSLSLSLKAENAEAAPLLTALLGVANLAGKGTLAADLTASGRTQEELVGTLAGTATLSLAQGRVAGTDLPGLAAAARQKILGGWSAAPGGTPFTSLEAAASVKDGIASFGTLNIAAPGAAFAVSGTADLLRRAVDLSAGVTRDGTPLLPVPVIARGPWGAPKIYPDIPDILNNPEGGFARLKDPGPVTGN